MKKAISYVMVAACAFGVGTSQMAQAETVPWFNAFETNTVGIPITNSSQFGSWTSTDDTVAMVTNIASYSTNIQSPAVSYPLPAANHAPFNNVVAFNGSGITNEVVGSNGVNVWVDLMIQPVPMDAPPVNEAVSNAQMSLFVDTNGFINVFHAALTNDSYTGLVPQWTVLSGFQIETGKWVRLTVKMDYAIKATIGNNLFQIRANGYLFTNAAAVNQVDPPTQTGTWFVCANSLNQKISGVAFSGTGMFDDLVVTNGDVDIQYVSEVLVATPYGTPQWWLAQFTNAGPYSLASITQDDTDSDGDGAQEWQEYVAGTIPSDPNSVLKLISQEANGATNVIKWLSSSNALSDYFVQASTNLASTNWPTLGTVVKIQGTNSYSDTVPLDVKFYRVSVTN